MVRNTIVLPVNATSEFNRGSTASPPSTPGGFFATAGTAEVLLQWNNVPNVLRYHIYFNTTGSVTTADTKISIDKDALSFNHTGLVNGTTYYYKIASVGPGGISALSSEVSATPSSYSNTVSLQFGGVDEYASFTSEDYELITISLWVKPDSAITGFPRIFDMPNYKLIYDAGNQRIQFRSQWTALAIWQSGTNSILKNAWTHILISYDASSTSNDPNIYINGSQISESEITPPSGTRASNSGVAFFGAETDQTDFYLGNIDESAIWDKALNTTEAEEVYATGSTPNLSTLSTVANLVHWWRMGDNDTFPTIQDNAGSRNLTMINMESGDIVSDVP